MYAGDVHFYSIDWDGREEIKRIDTNRLQGVAADRRIRLFLHAGDDRAVAARHPRSRLAIMEGMGHFPMIENYPAFRPYLIGRAPSRGGMSVRSRLVAENGSGHAAATSLRACAPDTGLTTDFGQIGCAIADAGRIDGDRHAVLPLHDDEIGIDAPAVSRRT